MYFSRNVINVLSFLSLKGIANAWISQNMQTNLNVDMIYQLIEALKIDREKFFQIQDIIEKKLNSLCCDGTGIKAVALGDDNFPEYRGNVKSSERPTVLFYQGNLDLLQKTNKNIAVIGLLNPDRDTETFEQKVVSKLVSKGVTIVSGLALGCDSIAHKQAIDSKGKTIAILPSSLNDILPKANRKLAETIVDNGGLLVTEYYEKAEPSKIIKRYIDRDRLQALFSDGIILSASYAKNNDGNDSGSRHAMSYAKQYNIPRAVMYNKENEGNPKYDLNRVLIGDKCRIINNDNMEYSIDDIISKSSYSNGWEYYLRG